jgi:hypothetical protein
VQDVAQLRSPSVEVAQVAYVTVVLVHDGSFFHKLVPIREQVVDDAPDLVHGCDDGLLRALAGTQCPKLCPCRRIGANN